MSQQSTGGQRLPPGTVTQYAGAAAPGGWLLCDGASYLRTGDYSGLFAAIGTTYGAADGTHFNVPDLRGRIPLGKDNMGGSSANRVVAAEADTLGLSAGEEKHQLTEAELAAHHHHVIGDTAGGSGTITHYWVRNQGATEINETTVVGGDTAHNNMQPYLTLNYIIKL